MPRTRAPAQLLEVLQDRQALRFFGLRLRLACDCAHLLPATAPRGGRLRHEPGLFFACVRGRTLGWGPRPPRLRQLEVARDLYLPRNLLELLRQVTGLARDDAGDLLPVLAADAGLPLQLGDDVAEVARQVMAVGARPPDPAGEVGGDLGHALRTDNDRGNDEDDEQLQDADAEHLHRSLPPSPSQCGRLPAPPPAAEQPH